MGEIQLNKLQKAQNWAYEDNIDNVIHIPK